MEYGRIIGSVVIVIIAAVLLYYLYDYLFNIGSIQKKAEIIAGPISSSSTVVAYPSGGDVTLNQIIYTGGEMSISFWMYVTGTQQVNSPYKKHILHLGTSEAGGSGNVLAILLGPATDNALYVKIAEGTTEADNAWSLDSYIQQTNNTMDTTGNCHIVNMEYGRWVNVIVVLNNNMCDIYMDGKLARSCVLKSQFIVPTTGTLKLYVLLKEFGSSPSKNTSWSGSLSGLNLYNYAIAPDEAYRIYFAGPSGASGDLWAAIKSFFGYGPKTLPKTA